MIRVTFWNERYMCCSSSVRAIDLTVTRYWPVVTITILQGNFNRWGACNKFRASILSRTIIKLTWSRALIWYIILAWCRSTPALGVTIYDNVNIFSPSPIQITGVKANDSLNNKASLENRIDQNRSIYYVTNKTCATGSNYQMSWENASWK